MDLDRGSSVRAQTRKVKPLIIVVEDDEPLRRMLRSILRINGYRVLLAGTSTTRFASVRSSVGPST